MTYKCFRWPQIFCVWERSEPEVLVVVPGMAHLVTLFFWGVSWHAPDPPWHFSEKHAVLPWAALFIMVVELLQGHTHTYTLFLYPRVMCHCSQHWVIRSPVRATRAVLTVTVHCCLSVPNRRNTEVVFHLVELCWCSKGKSPSPVHLWAHTPPCGRMSAWQAVVLVLSGVNPRQGVEDITGPLFLISLNQQWNYR